MKCNSQKPCFVYYLHGGMPTISQIGMCVYVCVCVCVCGVVVDSNMGKYNNIQKYIYVHTP